MLTFSVVDCSHTRRGYCTIHHKFKHIQVFSRESQAKLFSCKSSFFVLRVKASRQACCFQDALMAVKTNYGNKLWSTIQRFGLEFLELPTPHLSPPNTCLLTCVFFTLNSSRASRSKLVCFFVGAVGCSLCCCAFLQVRSWLVHLHRELLRMLQEVDTSLLPLITDASTKR